jgi:hypothetical protein
LEAISRIQEQKQTFYLPKMKASILLETGEAQSSIINFADKIVYHVLEALSPVKLAFN